MPAPGKEAVTKTIPKERKWEKDKWLSEKTLQIAEAEEEKWQAWE